MAKVIYTDEAAVIYVDAFPITGKHIAVRTTHGEVMDMVQTMRTFESDQAHHTYRSAYRAAIAVDGEAIAAVAGTAGAGGSRRLPMAAKRPSTRRDRALEELLQRCRHMPCITRGFVQQTNSNP